MRFETRTRAVRSLAALERLLAKIESGESPRPDFIALQGECRLDRLETGDREAVLARLHACVRRGFRSRKLEELAELGDEGRDLRLELWRSIARSGFHDFSTLGFTKCYDSPFVEDHDYVGAYLNAPAGKGLDALDPYQIYTAVLGSHDYTVEDFVHTPTCEKVETIVEPMAGTGEFAYTGHFRHPEYRYILFDLDERAREHVMGRRWLPGADVHYELADVLDDEIWKRIAAMTKGRSLAFIGKQSHHFFEAPQLLRLLDLGTTHVDNFILETPQVSLVSEMEPIDDLTRPEMEDAGFQAALIEEEDQAPNPFTNRMGFRLEVWDEHGARPLFHYRDWISWQPPMLVALARLLDLEVLYLCEQAKDFVSVDDDLEHTECLENVTFMLFRRSS